jgi:hypothetical protein
MLEDVEQASRLKEQGEEGERKEEERNPAFLPATLWH